MRKRIAILTGQADEEFQSRFIKGFLTRAYENDQDVCVFSMYLKYQDSVEREAAEANIYQLANWKSFDGVAIMKDVIQTPGTNEELENNLKQDYKGEVLTIDIPSDYFESVITDGHQPTHLVVSHLIKEHGYKKIAFLSGKKWHEHSKQRMIGFLDAMKEHHLEVPSDWIIYGDFWYTSGELCADALINSKEGLPEAVACANDCMAIGLCEAFEKRGIHVPEDIAVVGFDSREEGRTSPKPITSSILPAYENGMYASDYFRAKFENKPVPPYENKSGLFVGESCGCMAPANKEDFYRDYLRKDWGTEISEEGFDSVFNSMSLNLMNETTLRGYLNTVYSYVYQLRAEEFHLCLCDLWKNMETMNGLRVSNSGYPKKMIHAISYGREAQSNLIGLENTFNTSEMLPGLSAESAEPKAYFFTPFYYENICFGYSVISYGNRHQSYDATYRRWMREIATGLESVRRNICLGLFEQKVKPVNKFDFSGADTNLTEEGKRDFHLVENILNQNLFNYHFQPIVRTSDGDVYSYEALMRSATEKSISPLDIIKYAGMMGRLKDVEKATFINILGILEEKKEEFGDRKVFINSIPGVHISDEDKDRVTELLRKHAGNVVVELTEEAELTDKELTDIKEFLRLLGLEIAVDDYGTGFSNVNNLLRYMPNYVKIDRSLISDIQNKPQKQHFVREIIEFCHDNGIKALAEGVETKEELQSVIFLGADLIQGFYTARPNAEILPEIDEKIRQEIIRFKQEQMDGQKKHIYPAGRTNRIYVNNLVRNGYTDILVGEGNMVYKDIAIIGTPGLKSELHMRIEPDYEGRITLENVSFSNVKNRPCVEISPNAKVTLVLNGENRFRDGGIQVPEGASLTVEGEGNLYIEMNSPKGFGIGNYLDKRHGEITFLQDGEIHIYSKGKKGVCIGSGKGGHTFVRKGKYLLEGNGDVCVGLGSMDGDDKILVDSCFLELDLSTTRGVGVGSLNGDSDVVVSRSSLLCHTGGGETAGVGTLNGKKAVFRADNSNILVQARAVKSVCIGAWDGYSEIEVDHAGITLGCNGDDSFGLGGCTSNTKITLENTEVKGTVKNRVNRVTLAEKENIRIHDGAIRMEGLESF